MSHPAHKHNPQRSSQQSNISRPIRPPCEAVSQYPAAPYLQASLDPAAISGTGATPANATFCIRLVPHLDSRRSLRFDAITRDLREIDPALRIGRFTDRSGMGLAAVNALGTNKLAFKSKVVSRAHAEIWVEKGGKFLIKDTKSSSGTFLNHVRLSPANQESWPFQLKDGDILQLGVDYQGGAEDIYKSVKIRVEIGREWQASANAFKCDGFSFSFFFSRVLMMAYKHECFEKLEESRRRCRPSGTYRYTRCPCQRQHRQTREITNSRLLHMYAHSFLISQLI